MRHIKNVPNINRPFITYNLLDFIPNFDITLLNDTNGVLASIKNTKPNTQSPRPPRKY